MNMGRPLMMAAVFLLDPAQKGRVIEVVDGGIVFEDQNEPAIILWAKKPGTSH